MQTVLGKSHCCLVLSFIRFVDNKTYIEHHKPYTLNVHEIQQKATSESYIISSPLLNNTNGEQING